jgi:hypothetical protein
MNPDSLSAFKLLHDVDAAATEARPMRMTFNPVMFLEALHKRGWVIVQKPTEEEST